MRFAPAFLVLLAVLSVAVHAQDNEKSYLEKMCTPWVNVPIPQADVGNAPKDCTSFDGYYGSDGKGAVTNYVAARQCAYRERTGGDPNEALAFGGSGMLMMLYANGQGVKRNIPLAKRFSCEAGGWPFDAGWAAPAEIEGRLQHLDAIAGGKKTKPMDICDDVTSGAMEGLCSDRDAGFARTKREVRWSALQANWTPIQRAALANLRKAAETYFDNAARYENDMSGTAHEMIYTDTHEALDATFFAAVTRLEHGEQPPAKADDFMRADKALNAKYRATLASLAGEEKTAKAEHAWTDDEPTAEGEVITQRSWLPYREAWVAFGAARHPQVPADAWRAWLTRVRITQLMNPPGND